jgi:predicted O-methyltransferase YrrM
MSRTLSTALAGAICLTSALVLTGMSEDRPAPGAPDNNASQEKRVLEYLDHLHQNQSRGMMNVPPDDGKLLRILTQATNAQHVVEIGTSNGYSGIWICLGLQKTGGKLTTFDIDEGRARLARENFQKTGFADRVTLVLGDAHQEVTKLKGPVDLVFLDADKSGYADYLRKLLPIVRPGGLILAHNTTSQSRDMKEFLDLITTHPDLETTFVNVTPTGMSLSLRKH